MVRLLVKLRSPKRDSVQLGKRKPQLGAARAVSIRLENMTEERHGAVDGSRGLWARSVAAWASRNEEGVVQLGSLHREQAAAQGKSGEGQVRLLDMHVIHGRVANLRGVR
jgi:hypothetical protein